MNLLDQLKSEALKRDLIGQDIALDPELVFTLVRDMPYQRASDRRPETTIAEWQGTCSGKHYLLHALFTELGLTSKIVACTSAEPVDPTKIPPSIQPLYEAANRRFVDVHNYLLVEVPGDGQMIVDATFPLSARNSGMVVNETFVLGEDQQLAAKPLESFVIPPGVDAQEFKDELLHEHFTPAELEFREIVINAISRGSLSE
jgi:hypothetical protein